jgi:hypothetical protein
MLKFGETIGVICKSMWHSGKNIDGLHQSGMAIN